MPFYSKSLKRIIELWPGRQYFGIYRFLPLFFVLGAALEFSMINWHVGEVNFCRLIPLTMPAGVTWPRYLRFFAAAMLSMFTGAQVVHHFYRPLDDMDEWIDKAKTKRIQDSMKTEKD